MGAAEWVWPGVRGTKRVTHKHNRSRTEPPMENSGGDEECEHEEAPYNEDYADSTVQAGVYAARRLNALRDVHEAAEDLIRVVSSAAAAEVAFLHSLVEYPNSRATKQLRTMRDTHPSRVRAARKRLTSTQATERAAEEVFCAGLERLGRAG